MMSRLHAFDRILTALHDAMLDGARWPAASALIDEGVGTIGNTLLIGEGPEDDVRIVFAASHYRGQRREDLEQDYLRNYHPWDERVPRIRKLPDSELVHVTDLYTEAELKTSRTYNEFLPRSHGRNGVIVRLDGPDSSHLTWALYNPVTSGAWQSAQIDTVRRLLPHLRQFVRVRQAVAAAQAMGSSLKGLLDNARIGVVLLDRRGLVIEANARALDVLRRADGLFDRDGRLGAWSPADDARLQGLLSRALPASGAQGAAGTVSVGRASGQRRLVLHASPVEDRRPDFGARRVAALVLVVEPGSQDRLDRGLVSEAFGLTAAECEVAVMLSEGRTPRAIAALTGRRTGTVYNLIRLAYGKLGVSRQADLVRLLWQLSDISAPLKKLTPGD